MVKIPPVNTSSVDWNLTMANSAQLWQIKLIHPGQNWYYFEAHISSLFSPKGRERGVKDQLSAIFYIHHAYDPSKQAGVECLLRTRDQQPNCYWMSWTVSTMKPRAAAIWQRALWSVVLCHGFPEEIWLHHECRWPLPSLCDWGADRVTIWEWHWEIQIFFLSFFNLFFHFHVFLFWFWGQK